MRAEDTSNQQPQCPGDTGDGPISVHRKVPRAHPAALGGPGRGRREGGARSRGVGPAPSRGRSIGDPAASAAPGGRGASPGPPGGRRVSCFPVGHPGLVRGGDAGGGSLPGGSGHTGVTACGSHPEAQPPSGRAVRVRGRARGYGAADSWAGTVLPIRSRQWFGWGSCLGQVGSGAEWPSPG